VISRYWPARRIGALFRAPAYLRSTVTVIAECRSADGAVRHRRLRGRAIYPLTGQVLVATAQAMHH
jgi:hypothetical protein